jgi:hypothetical protein
MFKTTIRRRVDLGILISVAVAVAGCQAPADKTGSGAVPAGTGADSSTPSTPAGDKEFRQPAKVLTAHFQATIYEVEAVAERLSAVDGKALAKKATSAEGLLGALSSVGTTRILYRFDQPVNVFGETLRIGSSEPVVTGTRTSSGGQTINQVTYQQVGAIIHLSAWPPPREAKRKDPEVKVSAELAVLAASDVELAPGRKVTSTRSLSLQNTGQLEFGEPQVMLAVSSTSTDQQRRPAMYVIRYVFNR